MSPIHIPHTLAQTELLFRLRDAIGAARLSCRVVAAGSVRLGSDSVPEPDLLVWQPVAGTKAFPAASVLLTVEVCDSTHHMDLVVKPSLYAAAGIAEYWVADLRAGTLEQFWRPEGDGYAERRTASFGTPVQSATLPVAIATDGLERLVD